MKALTSGQNSDASAAKAARPSACQAHSAASGSLAVNARRYAHRKPITVRRPVQGILSQKVAA
jgi:hypothetical protein